MRRSAKSLMTLALVLGACTAIGCVGGSKSSNTGAEKERLKAFILDSAPADLPNKIDINYENKVHLIGYKIDPPSKTAKPGTEVKLTMYWRVDEKLPEGWSLFTHVLDSASNDRVLNIDNVGPIREVKEAHQALWPSAWEKGKVYVDEQTFKVPDDVKAAELAVSTGIWKGDARLKIVSGPADSDNRGIVVRIKTGVEKAEKPVSTQVPNLRVNKLAKDQKITIDGKLDEEAWKTAAATGAFVDVGTGKATPSFPVQGNAKVTWDDTNLYVAFNVTDPDIVGGWPKDAKDPHLWEKDTVEIMIDPDGDGDNNDYYEIQINPQNLVFDTQYDEYNKPKTEPNGPFGHQDWSSKLKSAVVVDGTMDKTGDKDKGYTVEAQIPWASFGKAKVHPPKPGDMWRMNFYAMQNNSGVAWSPILGKGNFHKAERFGKVSWMTSDMAPVAAASGSAKPVAAASASAAPTVPAAAKSAAPKQ